MHIAESDREGQIGRLGLPAPVMTFLRDLSASEELRYLFEPPHYFYSQRSPDLPVNWSGLGHLRLLPLWEHCGQIFVADLNSKPVRYLSFYIEPPQETREFGVSILSMIFHMLDLHVWDYGGTATEGAAAYALAKLLEFPGLDTFLLLVSNPVATTKEQVDNYKAQLVC